MHPFGCLGGVQIGNIPFILKFLKFKISFHFIAFDLGSVATWHSHPAPHFFCLFVILDVPLLEEFILLQKLY